MWEKGEVVETLLLINILKACALAPFSKLIEIVFAKLINARHQDFRLHVNR